MRVAVATLADAANVRDNTISMLSAGINAIWRPSYPSPLGITLALLLEISPEDDARDIPLEVQVRSVSDGEPIAGISGGMTSEGTIERRTNLPIVLPLNHVEIPVPGEYVVEVSIGQMEAIDLAFDALLLDT